MRRGWAYHSAADARGSTHEKEICLECSGSDVCGRVVWSGEPREVCLAVSGNGCPIMITVTAAGGRLAIEATGVVKG